MKKIYLILMTLAFVVSALAAERHPVRWLTCKLDKDSNVTMVAYREVPWDSHKATYVNFRISNSYRNENPEQKYLGIIGNSLEIFEVPNSTKINDKPKYTFNGTIEEVRGGGPKNTLRKKFILTLNRSKDRLNYTGNFSIPGQDGDFSKYGQVNPISCKISSLSWGEDDSHVVGKVPSGYSGNN